jgi:hypothetical protein
MEKKIDGIFCKSYKPESKSSHSIYKQTYFSLRNKKREKNKSNSESPCNSRRCPGLLFKMLHYPVYLFLIHNESYYPHFRTAYSCSAKI